VRMDGVRRDTEVVGDGELGAVVEHPTHELQFTPGYRLVLQNDFS
jgi:hypothetical protein